MSLKSLVIDRFDTDTIPLLRDNLIISSILTLKVHLPSVTQEILDQLQSLVQIIDNDHCKLEKILLGTKITNDTNSIKAMQQMLQSSIDCRRQRFFRNSQ